MAKRKITTTGDAATAKRTKMVTAPDPPAKAIQKCRFFSLLNEDVRNVIYHHLYMHLPPLCLDASNDCRGLTMACKQAKEVRTLQKGDAVWSFIYHLNGTLTI